MAENCNIPHPLKRQGTTQFDRFPDALSTTYVKLDERSLLDLVKQSATYSQYINYYSKYDISTSASDWTSFFNEIFDYSTQKCKFSSLADLEAISTTSPHLALFLSFLNLFGIAQNDLNSLTAKHLDFFYTKILQLQKNDPVPDRTIALIQLDKSSDDVLIKANSSVRAGKDNTGKELFYKTTEDIVVNKSQVASLKTVYVKHLNPDGSGPIQKITVTEKADSADGISEPITATPPSWYTFGNDKQQVANVGFALASPVLYLLEGTRTIFLKSDQFSLDISANSCLQVEYTTAKGWEALSTSDYFVVTSEPEFGSLSINISADKPAFAQYSEGIHKLNLSTANPALKITILPDHFSVHAQLTQLVATQVKIKVAVKGAKNLVLQNNSGTLDSSKPFLPFGVSPVINQSSLYVGYPAAFNKFLQLFSFNFKWKGIPANLISYYQMYWKFGNKSLVYFTYADQALLPGTPASLSEGAWRSLKPSTSVSTSDVSAFKSILNYGSADNVQVFSNQQLDGTLSLDNDYSDNLDDKSYTSVTKNNFIKISNGHDWGHTVFPKLFSHLAQVKTTRTTTGGVLTYNDDTINNWNSWFALKDPANALDGQNILPNQPYTPEFESMTLDYLSSAAVDLQNDGCQLFHIYPTGNFEITDPNSGIGVVPVFAEEGNLYIGLSGLTEAKSVSLHFQMHESSGDADLNVTDIKFSYLTINGFVDYSHDDLLKNTTNGFTTSGIIKFNIYKEALTPAPILPEGFVWIRISAPQFSAAFPHLMYISAQAVEVVFDNRGNDPLHLQYALPAASIKKMEFPVTGVKKILQPYSSYNGRMKEDDKGFDTRISEHLRHKHRSWNIWDYERMILKEFPFVYRAKCISHSTPQTEYAPGNVLIVVVPNLVNVNTQNLLKPRVSVGQRTVILDYIVGFTSPFVQLQVINPVYEELEVNCGVSLMADKKGDSTFWSTQLQMDLTEYLAPWIKNSENGLNFQGSLYKSQIIDFIEGLPYIDYVTKLDVKKHTQSGIIICGEHIAPSNESVILTSYSSHTIDPNASC